MAIKMIYVKSNNLISFSANLFLLIKNKTSDPFPISRQQCHPVVKHYISQPNKILKML